MNIAKSIYEICVNSEDPSKELLERIRPYFLSYVKLICKDYTNNIVTYQFHNGNRIVDDKGKLTFITKIKK